MGCCWKLIEKLVSRFKGVVSYDVGRRTLDMAKTKSNAFLGQPSNTFGDISPTGVPILATIKNRKQSIPYEDERAFDLVIKYINQDDITHRALCTIPKYSELDLDFKCNMQIDNDYVKAITDIDKFPEGYFLATYNFLNDIIGQAPSGWINTDMGTFEISAAVDGHEKPLYFAGDVDERTRIEVITDDSNTVEFYVYMPATDKKVYFSLKDSSNNLVSRVIFAEDGNIDFQGTTTDTDIQAYTANTWYHVRISALKNVVSTLYINGDLISSVTAQDFNIERFDIVTQTASATGYIDSLDFTSNTYYAVGDNLIEGQGEGNLNDTVNIVGLDGNIARMQGALAVMISDVFYNIRTSGMQRYVETAFGYGLKLLAKDLGLNLGSTYTVVEFRLFTSLFSTFVVPAKSIMQASMTTIYNVLDPEGYVIVTGDYDNPYRMDVDVYKSFGGFSENALEILVLFVERYRPVPASAFVNVIFPFFIESGVATDEGSVEITESAITMGETTLMGPSTIMGAGNISEPDLPTDYP